MNVFIILIEGLESILNFKLLDAKTHSERIFTISTSKYTDVYRSYRSLEPVQTSRNRLSIKYVQGTCRNQHIEIKTIREF